MKMQRGLNSHGTPLLALEGLTTDRNNLLSRYSLCCHTVNTWFMLNCLKSHRYSMQPDWLVTVPPSSPQQQTHKALTTSATLLTLEWIGNSKEIHPHTPTRSCPTTRGQACIQKATAQHATSASRVLMVLQQEIVCGVWPHGLTVYLYMSSNEIEWACIYWSSLVAWTRLGSQAPEFTVLLCQRRK